MDIGHAWPERMHGQNACICESFPCAWGQGHAHACLNVLANMTAAIHARSEGTQFLLPFPCVATAIAINSKIRTQRTGVPPVLRIIGVGAASP
jgi:hypothetical protein